MKIAKIAGLFTVVAGVVACSAEAGDASTVARSESAIGTACDCPCSKSGCDANGFCIADAVPDGTACTMLTGETGGTCLGGECSLRINSSGTCSVRAQGGYSSSEPIPSSGCKNLVSPALKNYQNGGGCSNGWTALCICYNGLGVHPLNADCSVTVTSQVSSSCTPTTCNAQGKNCGSISDGCGHTLACGTCTTPATCGGGGVSNVCGGGAPPAGGGVVLTLTASGRSGESISSSPAGLHVASGASGSASFAAGTNVTLSASNARDVIWSGICSSGGAKAKTCTFTIGANSSESANIQ
jgi:hypothetical protein